MKFTFTFFFIILWLNVSLASIHSVKDSSTTKLRTTTNRPLAGVIRWDMWDNGAHGTSNSLQTQIALNPSQYRNRIPFFGIENTPRTVSYTKGCEGNSITHYENISITIDGNSQAVMDQEIEYANSAGIDYFAFLKYGNDFYSYNLFKSSTSPYKNNVKFSYIIGYQNNSTDLQYILGDCIRSDYQKVLSNRPLIYLDFDNYNNSAYSVDSSINVLKTTFSNLYPSHPLPYIVVMCYGCQTTITNADAFSQYTTRPGGSNGDFSFNYISAGQQNGWNNVKNTDNVVPWVSVGYDRRPRIDFTVDWERDNSCQPAHPSTYWGEIASPQQITSEIIAAKTFISNNPTQCEANTFIIYAWNEHDEGGWICPTIIPGTTNIDQSRLDAVKSGIENGEVEDCDLLYDGKVLGTWTVTSHELVARFFHNKWWLTQQIGSNPDQFLVRGSIMLLNNDIILNSPTFTNLVDCFEWKYSEIGGLVPPDSTIFPTPLGYSYNGEFYTQGSTQCPAPAEIAKSSSDPEIGQPLTLTTSCSSGTPLWSNSVTGNSITVTVTSSPITYTVYCQGECATGPSKSIIITGSSSCSDLYLSSNWISAVSGYLTVQIGKNVGGNDITLGGINYSQSNPGTGIGTHANSEVIYNLGSHSYNYFKAVVGKEDGSMNCGDGRLIFKVYNNSTNALLFTSSTLGDPSYGLPSHQSITVDITGVTSLKLIVENAGGVGGCLWGTWAIARLSCSNSGSRVSMAGFPTLENINSKNLTVYPNPIDKNKKFNIRYISNEAKLGSTLSIINLSGKEVYSTKQDLIRGINNISIETNLLEPGTYVINIKSANTSVSEKFVVLD